MIFFFLFLKRWGRVPCKPVYDPLEPSKTEQIRVWGSGFSETGIKAHMQGLLKVNGPY